MRVNNLHQSAKFVLFITSYTPLFVLISIKQIKVNSIYLNWGGLSYSSIVTFCNNFLFSTILIAICFIGIIGVYFLFKNIERTMDNGDNVLVSSIDNKNSESIGYIATYIVPFLFQDFNDWYELMAFICLMWITYKIYTNSSLLLINPLLSFKFSIFSLEYILPSGKVRNGLIISREKELLEEDIIKIYQIGYKLFFAQLRKNR
ncbi:MULTISPECIES: hypothetical protein [Pasteurellaceae]|uniref:Uncharacterized protein n=1 Tax=Pasteurella atlantica TaxID=2827233 RepID=A0AAW8CQ76_9PAST|nr:hypothetical protein [Pasteurella atlantica]MBR0573522.1 hypothetical protein [Pasteurella atlantica]MDP8039523.1 hypothetical protein [Pasteurella atlantica]MDP8041614.1 hypothetical protein [Pasteurella atlantica]MDP8043751.1 hypothetical protein [Pasteurella atlantica]MDP8045752.1 hypothetical protein [Pasteurella atlantica]